MQAFLLSMLSLAAPEVKAELDPKGAEADVTFRLCEGLFIARRT
jgi:hypothetical protein